MPALIPCTHSQATGSIGLAMVQQAPCLSIAKHQWLLGMLGPCPLRRRSARTKHYLASAPVASAHSGPSGSHGLHKTTTTSSAFSSGRLDSMAGTLSSDNSPELFSGEPLTPPPVEQPLRLASKPQPRARTRVVLPNPAPPSPGTGDAVASGSNDGSPAIRGHAGLPRGEELSRVEQNAARLGLDDKAMIVRFKAEQSLKEDSAQLAAAVPRKAVAPSATTGASASPSCSITTSIARSSTLAPRPGERMPQLRLAQFARYRKRRKAAETQAPYMVRNKVRRNPELKATLETMRRAALDDQGAVDMTIAAAAAASDGEPMPTLPLYGAPWMRGSHPPAAGAPSASASTSGAASTSAGPSSSSLTSSSSSSSSRRSGTTAPQFDLPPTRAELEALVRACKDLDSLRALYDKHTAMLRRQELVLVTSHLAAISEPAMMTVRVWTASQGLLVELLQRLTPDMMELSMHEFVVILAAVAKLRYVPPSDWVAAVLTQSKKRLYNASPSFLTTALRAVARLAVDPADVKDAAAWEAWMKRFLSAVARQVDSFRGDELVKTLVAMSELRYRPPPEWMTRFSAALYAQMDSLGAQALSEVMLAFAALRYQPEAPFLRAYYSQLYSRLPLADDRDLATYAQAASMLDRLVKQEFMHEFLAEVLQKLPTFKPQPLANLLNAMGRLAAPPAGRLRPPPGWTEVVVGHLMAGRQLMAFSGPALASMAWGLSVLGHKASPWFLHDLLSASFGKLHACGPTDLVLLLTALGNFGYRPMPGREAFWDSWLTEFEKLAARKHYDTRAVCDLMAAMARLPRPPAPGGGVRPPHPDMVTGVLRSTRMYSLRNTSPGRLAAMAGSLAELGVRPDFGFLYNFAQAARYMWTNFSMRDYAVMLDAMVAIGSPGVADPRWAGDFLALIRCRMAEFDGPGLTAALDALRRLPKPEFQPSQQWLAAAVGRAVEIVRAPPPPQAAQPPGGGGPAQPASSDRILAPTGPVDSHLSVRPDGTRAGVGAVAPTGEGRLVPVPPMQPLTPDHVVALLRALVALGYRAEPQEPLVHIVRGLLARNARLWDMLEGGPQAVATGTVTAAPPQGPAALQQQPQQQQQLALPQLQHSPPPPPPLQQQQGVPSPSPPPVPLPTLRAGALGSEAVPEVPRPRPLLSREAAAELSASLEHLLGFWSQAPAVSPSHSATVGPQGTDERASGIMLQQGPSSNGTGPMMPTTHAEAHAPGTGPGTPVAAGGLGQAPSSGPEAGKNVGVSSGTPYTLPRAAVRTTEDLAAAQARWAAKQGSARRGSGGGVSDTGSSQTPLPTKSNVRQERSRDSSSSRSSSPRPPRPTSAPSPAAPETTSSLAASAPVLGREASAAGPSHKARRKHPAVARLSVKVPPV